MRLFKHGRKMVVAKIRRLHRQSPPRAPVRARQTAGLVQHTRFQFRKCNAGRFIQFDRERARRISFDRL